MPTTDALLGATLGHFRVLSVLGRGGMGVVYLAEDLDLYRHVALKVLPPGAAAEEHRRARFLREARAAAAVAHANIATIYEVGTSESVVFLAMELVRGTTLREELARGLARDRALAIALGIARGLARAHEVGVLHRDIKPENVMIDRDDTPKILDFGLARALADVPERITLPAAAPSALDALAPRPAHGNHVSVAGAIVGTPGYLSPEQARGLDVDARSDVYALGIVLFELLTGQLPFAGDTPIALLTSVLVDEPPPLGPYGVPEPIATLVARCLASDPADRFADAGEVRDALLALRLDRSAAARARPPDATIDSAVTRFATSASSTSALAHSRDPLLGRERETSELVALLDGGARFVTITGLGGIGKSRLAAEVARRLHARDRRRVLHVSLGAVRAVRDALAALAATLGADLAAAHDDDEATSTALALSLRSHGRVLLLVDDAEGVARGLAEWLVRALAAAPEALLLVTSRERLGVDMERAYPLGPLDADSGAELFLERARAARPTLGRDAATRDVARDIAHRLEGSPLAIELAAARASLLAPEAIRDRLDDRLRLLTSRASGGSSRHSSLRAVLEWSWSLLDENERAALGQMAAFRDPAPVEAAEAIVSLPDAYALDVLTALRDKSLLRVDDRPDGVTFVMDESVRLYAEEAIRRAPEAWNAACARHAAHFGRSAADAVALSDLGLDGRGDAWLADHHRDLFAAADRALAAEGATLDDGAACVAALGRARTQHGVAARDRVAAFVERTSALRPEVAADLLVAHARLEIERGVRAVDAAERAVDAARRTGDAASIARALAVQGEALVTAGELARAAAVCETALEHARRIGDPSLEEIARRELAYALSRVRPDAGREVLAPAIESAHARGAHRVLPELLIVEAGLLSSTGQHERAMAAETEALERARVVGLERLTSLAHMNLGLTLERLGRLDDARAHMLEAIAAFERGGQTVLLAVAHGNLGFIAHAARALPLARSHYERAVALLAPTTEHRWKALYLAARGVTLAETDRVDDAARDLDDAEKLAAPLEEPGIHDAITVLRGHLEVARARVSRDPSERAALLAAARARMAHAENPRPNGVAPVERSDVTLSAVRSLSWAIADAER